MENISHQTWIDMQPLGEDCRELFDEYYQRMSANPGLRHIPKEVYEQWIFGLHQDADTLRNYSWLDYRKVSFSVVEWTIKPLIAINVVDEFQDYYLAKSRHQCIEEFSCLEEDLVFWETHGTWRIPPIVIDISTVKGHIPAWSNLKGPYQLVEGHTRLGYLNSFSKITNPRKFNTGLKHRIYLMQVM